MKIFWVVNVMFPYVNEHLRKKNNPLGGWLIGLFNKIINDKRISLAIATVYDSNEYIKLNHNNVVYYLIPRKKQRKFWNVSVSDFNPDLIHIHGTEYEYGKIIQSLFPDKKTIVSIQGLVSVISDYYIANIKRSEVLKNITFKDIVKGSIYKEQKQFIKRGICEQEILKNSTAIVGRTNWDYACSYGIVGKDKYYKCNENLRDSFYHAKWNINNIEKNSIFISQACYPIKGFHIMLEAARVLKYRYGYKDLKIYVAGSNITDTTTFGKKIKLSGYGNYIKSLIKKYHLQENIIFTGLLNEKEMIDRLLLSNVFVQASSIENSPNSLGEAMLIGMPCVASNVGGTSDLLKDKEEGFLYPFGDYNLLAYYIHKIFYEDGVATLIGNKASKHANITHNRIINTERMIEIYSTIINK